MPVGTLTQTVHPKQWDSWNQYLKDTMTFLPEGTFQGVKRDLKGYESFLITYNEIYPVSKIQ